MKLHMSDFLILIGVGVLLLILDRIYRINSRVEAFQNSIRCGVDLPPCMFGKKCMNGICVGTNVPNLKPNSLPVFP